MVVDAFLQVLVTFAFQCILLEQIIWLNALAIQNVIADSSTSNEFINIINLHSLYVHMLLSISLINVTRAAP